VSFRKTRKFKEKPAIFAFGHIMLPLVGILALGLLVLGVRLLFVNPGGQISYPEPSRPQASQPDPEPEPEIVVADQQSEIVAVPVVEDTDSSPSVSLKQDNEVAKASKPSQTPATKPTATNPLPSTDVRAGTWVVQIGAFTLKESAEALAKEARGKKYEAFVFQAEVGGKTYYRVRVGAGSQRTDAETLARDLASKGYPTLVTRHE
jgi:cell division septation protein DedD